MGNIRRTFDHLRSKGLFGYLQYKRDKVRKRMEEERQALEFYAQFIKPGDVCFDVGANRGNRTRRFLELGAKVICVEPQEACAHYLRSHFKGKPAIVLQTALGERPGMATMMLSSADTVSSMSKEWVQTAQNTGRFGATTWDKSVEVPVTTLDELIRQHGTPSFVKIDVEGYEYPVLRGLSQPVPCLSFEFVGEDLGAVKACLGHLQTLGRLECNFSLGESMTFHSPQWMDSDTLLAKLATITDSLPWGDAYARFQRKS
ncbi:MAG: FkbM family methyltransferase [Verrucomicrobia bacterium]|nr:FkbM family methyltransferase [Verrucomicrobiota bacterium]